MTQLDIQRIALEQDAVFSGPLRDADDFAEAHGLTIECVLQLIEEHGNDYSKIDAAALVLKAKIASH